MSILIDKYLNNDSVLTKFLIVYTFSADDMNAIRDQNSELYFDSYGNISTRNPVDNTLIYSFTNPLPRNKFMSYISTNKVDNNKKKQNFIFSPNLVWVIYFNQNIGVLLYNFIHTKVFQDFYKQTDANGNRIKVGDTFQIFKEYCQLVQGLDPTCSCTPINADICIERFAPGYLTNIQATPDYLTLKSTCQYFEPGCKSKDSLPNSFLKSYYQENPEPSTLTLTICSQNFRAGGNIDIDVARITQSCQSIYGKASPPSSTTPVTPGTSSNPSEIEDEIPPPSVNPPPESAGKAAAGLDTKYYTGIAIVVVIIIIIFSIYSIK